MWHPVNNFVYHWQGGSYVLVGVERLKQTGGRVMDPFRKTSCVRGGGRVAVAGRARALKV